jgi:exonuclease VII small subunit
MDEFEDHKVDRLVKKLEKEEENLELKLLLLDKMDGTVQKLDENTSNFEELEGAFNKLISQWRKVGRVPSEKNQALWNRFNAVQDTFNELRFKFDKKYRESIEKALEKKKKLVKEAQALVDQDNIAQAARKVNKLHKRWKKAGNLPQKEENEMWDLFKAATDKFNELKSDNLDVLRKQEEENLTKKHALIEKAVEAKDTDNFDTGHQTMQNLMSQWKKIGPVPRKKSSKIWKQFKGAMDVFYDRRREAFKGQRKDQKENLARKEQILEKLAELGKHEDPALAVQEAKKLQEEFKDAGYVPIKVKNKIWKQYREACDVIYDRYRSLGADLGMEKKLANQGIDPDTRKDIIKYQKERDKLKKDVSKLESEMIQYEEAQTYFKPTNKGNALKDELQQKIDKAEKSIEKKQDRLSELRKQIDQLKRSGDNNDEEE